jgi:ribonuclease D
METEFTYIDTADALDELVAELRTRESIPVDTEADNLHHYATRVCLIQISSGGRQFLVDTLIGLDLKPLFSVLAKKILIMHGSDYDLRLLWELTKFKPKQVFDTMLAAQLVGHDRIGLGSLLKDFLDVHHPKDSQKADWSKRPLPPKMLDYAARDVLHLTELRDVLAKRLEDTGRTDWHRQKCDWQIRVATSGFPESDEHAWRLGPSRRFSPQALAALYELWHWRESEAERLDRPPFKVISNDYLTKLSLAVDEGSYREAYRALPNGLRRGKSRGLLEVLERAAKKDPKTLPKRPASEGRPLPLNGEELARQESIRGHRDKVAQELKIDATLIASRSQIAQIARKPGELDKLLLPWQADLLRESVSPCVSK